MSKTMVNEAELLAQKFRSMIGAGMTEPLNMKTLLRKLDALTIYRPLSDTFYGISIRKGDSRFMMVNSNTTRGRQHFTIAHELFHLFYDDNPLPHICNGTATGTEKSANLFAAALLMPQGGLLQCIGHDELREHKISLATILKSEQLFGVSRMSLLLRLKDVGVITESQMQPLQKGAVESAKAYGYDTSLYEKGNEGVVIGDFGAKARKLFEEGKISEGHYWELLNMLKDATNQG